MEIIAREFEILYENKISDRKKKFILTGIRIKYMQVSFYENHNSFLVTLEISHLIKRITMDAILDTKHLQREFEL